MTLTVAGLAMGMMIFIMASGLTLIFGLMDVLNFGHGAFISLGAYVALIAIVPLAPTLAADSLLLNLLALAAIVAIAMLVTGVFGYVFERADRHAGLRPAPEADPHHHGRADRRAAAHRRAVGRRAHHHPGAGRLPRLAAVRRRRGGALSAHRGAVGLVVFVGMVLVLNRTKIGLLIRAGVENGEMVEALGYRIRRLFVGVFVAGSALAGLGGVLWAFYKETLTAGMGLEVQVLIFIVVIIGGLGSVGGCFIGALLVALLANYTGFLAPKLALGSNILLMVLILLWRSRGLYPLVRR